MSEVQDRDLGLTRIMRELGDLDGAVLTVGIHEEAGEHEGGDTTVAQVGLWMEVGTKHVPARPWLSTAIDDNQRRIEKIREQVVGAALDGDGITRPINMAGEAILTMVREKIRTGDPRWAPLAPGTIEAKGSSKPLINTAQLLQSNNYKAEVGGKEMRGG